LRTWYYVYSQNIFLVHFWTKNQLILTPQNSNSITQLTLVHTYYVAIALSKQFVILSCSTTGLHYSFFALGCYFLGTQYGHDDHMENDCFRCPCNCPTSSAPRVSIFSHFSCMFLNPNDFFQFEFWLFQFIRSEKPPRTS
jgi:hypothetical protein